MLWNKSRPLRFLPACWAQRDIACRLWNPYKNQWLKKNKKKVLFIRPFFATWFLAVWCLKVVYFLAVQTGPLSGPGPPPLLPLTFLTDRSLSAPCFAAEETFFNVDSNRLCLSRFVPWPSLYICDLNLLPAVQTYSYPKPLRSKFKIMYLSDLRPQPFRQPSNPSISATLGGWCSSVEKSLSGRTEFSELPELSSQLSELCAWHQSCVHGTRAVCMAPDLR